MTKLTIENIDQKIHQKSKEADGLFNRLLGLDKKQLDKEVHNMIIREFDKLDEEIECLRIQKIRKQSVGNNYYVHTSKTSTKGDI